MRGGPAETVRDEMFLDTRHRERFYECVEKDGTSPGDLETISLFLSLTGSAGLYDHRLINIYDFDKHRIKDLNFEDGLGSGRRAMFQFAIGLFGWATPIPEGVAETSKHRTAKI